MADTCLYRIPNARAGILLCYSAGGTCDIIFCSIGKDFQFFHEWKLNGNFFCMDCLNIWFYLKCRIHNRSFSNRTYVRFYIIITSRTFQYFSNIFSYSTHFRNKKRRLPLLWQPSLLYYLILNYALFAAPRSSILDIQNFFTSAIGLLINTSTAITLSGLFSSS